ncbi:hypothetical protein ACWD4K_37485 [Streptomyces gelaticus]
MSSEPSRAALERLRTITWDDPGAGLHPRALRALLMREYMRRAALWARACGAEEDRHVRAHS